ncbi:MAG: hypothetical protein EOM85_03215, partial [Candidatus Moranbacteria bacterium]|nr:hypothetical protein [Candidatus Moranbacteria bacterium]
MIIEQSRFIAMMNNYERTLELTEVAADSSGASIIQFADTLDSVQAKLNKIQSNFERLMGFIVENTFVKTILDITNMFLDFAGDIAKKGWIPFSIFIVLLWQNFKLLVAQLIQLASNAFNKISLEAKKIPPIIVKFIADTTHLDMVRRQLGMPAVGVPEKIPNS